MASTSRTYLSSDWKVWTYSPVSGAFRLDFSLLDGSDTLSATNGSMSVLDLDISAITIQDGERPLQSVFGQVSPATATITASLRGWSPSTVEELYLGKPLAITLKNESAIDVDVYGRNSVFFLGVISSSTFNVDPINEITTFNIQAEDIFTSALNQSFEVNRSTTATKSSSLFTAISNNSQLLDSHLVITPDIDLTANYESNSTESRALGAWLDDFISTYVAIPESQYSLNGTDLERVITLRALYSKPTSGIQITDEQVLAVTMANDGGDIPTSFNLYNSTVTYNSVTDLANILTLPVNYTTSLDVNGATQLQNVATKISSYTAELNPVEITLNSALPYQPITFEDTQTQSAGQYYYPNSWYANGTALDIYLDYFSNGVTTPHYYATIVSQSQEITPDYWNTTYQLMKGK